MLIFVWYKVREIVRESCVFYVYYFSFQGGVYEGVLQEMYLVGIVYYVFVKVIFLGIGIVKFKKWVVVFLILRFEFYVFFMIYNEVNI